MSIYLQLFLSFLQVGAFSIGGGYAALPLIQSQVVTTHGWLTITEFTDLVTIAEMTPGPIAINAATFVGIRIAGLPGAVVATLGAIVPSCIIASLLAFVYYRYKNLSLLQSVLASLRPAVVALIAGAGLSILKNVAFADSCFVLAGVNVFGLVLFAGALFLIHKKKCSPILVMVLCGVGNLLATCLLQAL